MRKLDHSSIYMMIAGNLYPYLFASSSQRDWSTASSYHMGGCRSGPIAVYFLCEPSKIISSIIYIIAGYLIVPYMGELKETFGGGQIALLSLAVLPTP